MLIVHVLNVLCTTDGKTAKSLGPVIPLHGQSRRERRELSSRDKEWRRGNQMWLTAAGLAIAAYFFLSGQYIQFSADYDFDEDDADDE